MILNSNYPFLVLLISKIDFEPGFGSIAFAILDTSLI